MAVQPQPRGRASGVVDVIAPVLRSRLGTKLALSAFRAWVGSVARDQPGPALKRLVTVYDALYDRIDLVASDADAGAHAKHRLTSYHDYFVDRIGAGEHVLDVGCGKGELAADLARRAGARVTAIDFNAGVLAIARGRVGEVVDLVEADATTFVSDERFDVVVLSNVLEHIADRVGLLRHLVETTGARRFLVRVPVWQRHWLVPLRRELGLPDLSDPTHEIEYEQATFRAELAEAGLEIDELEIVWGEIWASARPRSEV